ncbi:glycerol-3-phosphate dehydrogenase/oxidase [Alteromonas flava]|uniref:glycerol-3-phosphate dehydrogenase/oxidase n=1 Tax=Alteromonas flava TaxID=2048003 RepID=UPI001F0C3BAC|nr:glycerol-3-phosphate dehydrogenase/oxidase [Alteromonas flava]
MHETGLIGEQMRDTQLRDTNIKKLAATTFDVLVIGGGINGAVSAAALAKKGAKAALVDKGDFAGFTSSNSSNLAWGGIKYLENHEYLLVNKLCKSRNHLMRSYPSTVKEIRFLTTLQKGFRFPHWFIYLGACLYWLMGRFFTQAPKMLSAAQIKQREPVINVANASGGLEYSDAFLFDNDARFVFNFIRSAMDNDACVANYVQATQATRVDGLWQVEMECQESQKRFTVTAKTIINACGPYVDSFNQLNRVTTEHSHVFSKGVHLLVRKLTQVDKVLAFFASDGRLFFVIPMGKRTCIGTTDTQVEKPETAASEADRQFILDNVNKLLALPEPLTMSDVIAERCGVRPLAVKGGGGKADWVQLSRKHAIDVDTQQQFISVFGGKLTDCINVGEEVSEYVSELGIALPDPKAKWYGESPEAFKQAFLRRAKLMGLDALTPAYCSESLTTRLWRRYDANAIQILDEIQRDPSQAEQLIENAEYIRAELHYAARREMITRLDDFLRRRSKIEMVLTKDEIISAKGLQEACAILFGDKAERKLQEYIDAN